MMAQTGRASRNGQEQETVDDVAPLRVWRVVRILLLTVFCMQPVADASIDFLARNQ